MNTYSIRIVDRKLNTLYEADFTNKKPSDVIDYIGSLNGNGYKLIATGSSSKQNDFNPDNDNLFLAFRKKRWFE
jgi:hypothetical protein